VSGLSDFDRGLFVGLLVGEGSIGGDGKQPQITLRMHVRHEAVFRWLTDRFPETRLYGPYHHGGRSYYQWMARGRTLVRDVLPVLERVRVEQLDSHAADRLAAMRERYAGYIQRERAGSQRQPSAPGREPSTPRREAQAPHREPGAARHESRAPRQEPPAR
jgi:hypothetical protein